LIQSEDDACVVASRVVSIVLDISSSDASREYNQSMAKNVIVED
jgi:hypothetical protein